MSWAREACSARVWKRAERAAIRRDETRAYRRMDVPGLMAWMETTPGDPLGPGMPSGASLREDGESHAQAWRRLLRADPCSYCGGEGGTVDHVEPRASGRALVERPPNLVGACQACNQSKGATPLLLWLLARPRAAGQGRRAA